MTQTLILSSCCLANGSGTLLAYSFILTQPISIHLFAMRPSPWLTSAPYMLLLGRLDQSVSDSALLLLPILISLPTFTMVPVMGQTAPLFKD